MDILALIQCSDGQIEVKVKKLLKFQYFRKMLNNFNKKMEYKKEIIKENNMNVTIYQYRIPELSVDCSSKAFKILLECHYYIYSFKEKELLLELLLYADMYQMPFQIHFKNCFRAEQHMWFMKYIKDELPYINAFILIEKGGFCLHTDFIEHAFELMSNNELDILGNGLTYDMLEFVELHMQGAGVPSCDQFRLKIMLNAICSIKHLYALYPEQIKKIINAKLLKDCLEDCVSECNCLVNIYNLLPKEAEKFNAHKEKLFNEYLILEQLNLVCMAEIGNKDDYKKITYMLQS